jgi:CheY-like chemotaxis protein
MGKSVLVVDDHPPVVRLIRDALVREGYLVTSAQDGAECLHKVEADRPDLVILDVVMPVMDGFDVLRALRQSPDTRYLPVIMLTARKSHGDILDGWMGGADSYLTKPCRVGDVVATVKRMLGAPTQH